MNWPTSEGRHVDFDLGGGGVHREGTLLEVEARRSASLEGEATYVALREICH